MSAGDDVGLVVDGYRWWTRWSAETPLMLQIRRQPVELSVGYQPARDQLTLDQEQLEWMLSDEGRATLAVHGRRPAPSSSADVRPPVRAARAALLACPPRLPVSPLLAVEG